MGCTHPIGIEWIYDDAEEIIGGRCPVCKTTAYVSDATFWDRFCRWLGFRREAS